MSITEKSTQSFSLTSFGYWLVLAMALLQTFYSFSAFINPIEFASYRGTPLAPDSNTDWVRIYASRTLFVAGLLGILLLRREVALLKWVSLLGIAMPLSDAVLAFQASASVPIVSRHLATILYLLVTFAVLAYWQRRNELPPYKSLERTRGR